MESATLLVFLLTAVFALSSVSSIEVDTGKEKRQDYFDYGGADDAFISTQGDAGSEGFEFGSFFKNKKKDSFSSFYGDPEGDEGDVDGSEGDEGEGDGGIAAVLTYPDDEGGEESEGASYDYGDVDYEGTEKKESKEARSKDPKTKRKDTIPKSSGKSSKSS